MVFCFSASFVFCYNPKTLGFKISEWIRNYYSKLYLSFPKIYNLAVLNEAATWHNGQHCGLTAPMLMLLSLRCWVCRSICMFSMCFVRKSSPGFQLKKLHWLLKRINQHKDQTAILAVCEKRGNGSEIFDDRNIVRPEVKVSQCTI